MSYTHQLVEYTVQNTINLATDAPYTIQPGYQPFVLRAVAAVITTTTATAAITVTITRRPTPGSATSEVTLGVLTIPSGTAAGKVVYKGGFEALIVPGDELALTVGGTGTGNGSLIISVEPSWDVPGNFTDMIASAT